MAERLAASALRTYGVGHLTYLVDDNARTTYSYDLQGRLLTKAQGTLVGRVRLYHNLTSTYNAQGQLGSQTYPSGLQIGYGYNAQGRINSLTANGQVVLNNLVYQPFGPPKQWTWGNGQAYARAFNNDGRLVRFPLGSDPRVLSYDAAGRIMAYSHSNPADNRSFAYDLADRLSDASDTTTTQSFQYDANGNRTSHGMGASLSSYVTALDSNHLLSVQGPAAKTYTYDAAGHITSDSGTGYAWNAAGRLASATTGGLTHYYKTNGFGERVLKYTTSPYNVPLVFLYDGAGHLVGEYTTDSTGRISVVKQETLWLGDLPVAMVKKDPATQQFQVYPIQADHLNAPRVILNSANVPVWRWDTADAFGNGLPNEDPDADGSKFAYNLRFPGQYYDSETGMHYNYFRDYDPKTGTYYSSDPIGLAGGMNTYAYVGGNPVNFIDPLGLYCTYSQSTGAISCTNEQGYAGTGNGRNNPNAQAQQSTGPLPRGQWQVDGPWRNSPNTGRNTITLIPLPGNECPGTGRDCSSFRIHGNNRRNDASHGCIVLPPNRTTIPSGEIIEVIR